jgi:acetyl esterase
MPLDPQVQAILDAVARFHQGPRAMPSMQTLGAQAARQLYERQALVLDIASVPLELVEDHQVVLNYTWALGSDLKAHAAVPVAREIIIRQYSAYRPSWARAMPAVLFFHGGGFTIGSINTHDRICRMLAKEVGCQVFSVNYRLAPENTFPGAVNDAFASLGWLRENAHQLGVDVEAIALAGDSAGGTLAAATAIFARDQGWPLRLQALIYPGLSHDQMTASHERLKAGYLLDADLIQWFFNQYLRDPRDRLDWRFSPLLHPALAGVAPVWLAHAEFDPLRDEGVAYANRLRLAGVSVSEKTYLGMVHAFFQHAGAVKNAGQAHRDCVRALKVALFA